MGEQYNGVNVRKLMIGSTVTCTFWQRKHLGGKLSELTITLLIVKHVVINTSNYFAFNVEQNHLLIVSREHRVIFFSRDI